MRDELIQEFSSLWGSNAKDYVLECMDPGGADLRRCGIFDRRHKCAVLIEDSDTAFEVMRRMVQAGVEIVNKSGQAKGDILRS